MIIALALTGAWIAIAALAVRVEREIRTRRHVKMVTTVMDEELKRVRVESLGIPGGIQTVREQYLSLIGRGYTIKQCLDCKVPVFVVLNRDGYERNCTVDGSYHICK